MKEEIQIYCKIFTWNILTKNNYKCQFIKEKNSGGFLLLINELQ